MNKLILCCGLLSAAALASAFTPPFENLKIKRNDNSVQIAYGPQNRFSASGAIFPKELATLVSISEEEKSLVIDTTHLAEKAPKGVIRLNFNGIKAKDVIKQPGDRTNRISVRFSCDRSGIPVTILIEGNALDKEGKRQHYWRAKNAVSVEGEQTVSFDQIFPESISGLSVRFQVRGGAVFHLYEILCEPVTVKSSLNPAKNYLWNGGAERQFYGTFMYAPRFAFSEGVSENWESRVKIDTEIKHSGKASFRFDKTQWPQRTYFNPVPFEQGKPIQFTAWIKADTPCNAEMSMFNGNGSAYLKPIKLTTKWEKYEMLIPAWGEKPAGITKIGGMGPGGLATMQGHTYPHFMFPNNVTVWVDDMAVHSGGKGQHTPERGIMLSGQLDNPSLRYTNGAEVTAKLHFSNMEPAAAIAAPAWELSDFHGRILKKGVVPAVSVAANGTASTEYKIQLPKDKFGPMNLRFTMNDETVGFILGVLPDGQKNLDKRIGVNYSYSNHDRSVEMLSAFRIGAVRIWSHHERNVHRGFTAAKPFHDAGFYTLMCIETQPDRSAESQVPRDLKPWAATMKTLAAEHRGFIDAYEILNEPNIWSGLRKNPDPAKFRDVTPEVNAECIRVLGKAIHEGDPNTKLAGPTTCGTAPGWPVAVLTKGADKDLDIISEHCYRDLPELPDYEPELKTLMTAVRKFKNFPVISTESGYQTMSIYPDHQRISDLGRNQADRMTRLTLIGIANGLDQFYQFSFCLREQGNSFGLSMMGGADNAYYPIASPTLYATRGMIDRIYGAKPLKRLPLGSNYRCYLFDRGDVRVAALWKWNGAAETVNSGWKNGTMFDMFGTKIAQDQFVLNTSPIYFESAASAAELEKQIAKLPLRGDSKVLDIVPRALDSSRFEIEIRNLTGNTLSGILSVGKEKKEFKDLAPEACVKYAFHTQTAIGLKEQTLKAEALLASGQRITKAFTLKGIFPARSGSKIIVDGNNRDWSAVTQSQPLTCRTKLNSWTPAEDSTTASAKFAWDPDYLYVLVTVNKGSIQESSMKTAGTLFLGDSVQIAMDTIRNATPGQIGFQDDDFEYSIGNLNGKTLVYRHFASAPSYDSLEKQIGIAQDVKAAVSVKDGKTVYEIAFPRRAVSPFRLEPGSAMRINVLVNIANAKGRAGYLELTPGIGAAKQPGKFMDLILEKK